MGSDNSPNFDDRIGRLEADLAGLQSLADLAAERASRPGGVRNPRLAVTCRESETGFPSPPDYPLDAHEPDTYYIRFVDGTFAETPPNQTPIYTARQTAYGGVAHNILGHYIPEGTKVWVVRENHRWWIIQALDLQRWAKAIEDWEENYGILNPKYPAGQPRVKCRACDRDGANLEGTADDWFWVYLPRNPRVNEYVGDPSTIQHDADPAVYSNWVISYRWEPGGRRVCTSPYLHMGRIRDIRMQGTDCSVPTGWHVCDGSPQTGASGTFNLIDFRPSFDDPLGHAGVADYGYRWGAVPVHKSGDYGIGAHPWIYVFDALGTDVIIKLPSEGTAKTGTTGAHNHDINCQVGEYPLAVVYFIQRFK